MDVLYYLCGIPISNIQLVGKFRQNSSTRVACLYSYTIRKYLEYFQGQIKQLEMDNTELHLHLL